MSLSFPIPSLLPLLLLSLSLLSSSQATFQCTTQATCRAIVDYKSPNQTTLSHIQSLFNVTRLLDIIGVNSLPSSTLSNHSVPQDSVIRIPFPCRCSNGSGLSDRVPVYVIKKDDTLSHIATDVFANLVTYQMIEQVNNITDPTLIQPGQQVWIPLPCSCDKVNGTEVVHYGYRVPSGSSYQEIAQKFGTTGTTLLQINNVTDPKSLLADQIIDVPLQACSSSAVRNDSLDYPLLVANGTDAYTANGCVKCTCSSNNNSTLQCESSGLKASSVWSSCPSTECGSFSLGNITSTASCSRSFCAYAGYNNQTIFTTNATLSTCPASGASSHGFYGWNHLLIVIHVILISLYVF